jgi:hypothetical protein
MKSNPAIAAPNDGAERATLFWGLDARQAAILAGILLVTLAIYLPSLRNGWVLDDRHEFIDNKLIHNWSFLWNSFRYDLWWFRDPARIPQSPYYRPLENVWFAVNSFLFGANPALWHLAKIALNVVVVALSFRVAQLLTHSVAIALLTAAIFGTMPANAGAVVYASGIPQPLSTAFELGAMICLIRRKRDSSRGLMAATVLYTCAVLTHESAILFPLIVVAYLFIFEDAGGETAGGFMRFRSMLHVCAPFLIVLIAYVCARANALGVHSLFGLRVDTTGTSYSRGFVVVRPAHSRAQVLMTLPAALLTYLAVVAIPGVAGPAHDVDWVMHLRPIVFIDVGVLLALAAIAFIAARRSPDRRIYLFCAIWIFLTIAPALNLDSILWLVDDRYLYTPTFGWSLAVAVALTAIASSGAIARNIVGVAFAVTIALYVGSIVKIQSYWHDDVAFFSRAVEVAPDLVQNRLDLANALDSAGNYGEAASVLESAVPFTPNDAHLHLKLAREYQKLGRVLDFEREFRKFAQLSAAMAESKDAASDAAGEKPAP